MKRRKASPPPDVRFLNAAAVKRRYSISEPTLWRWLRDGVFPRPDRIIAGRRFWLETTLERFDRRPNSGTFSPYARHQEILARHSAE